MKLKLSLLLIFSLLIFSCSSKTKSDSENNDVSNSSITTDDKESNNEDVANTNIENETTIETNTSSDCGLDDGTYSSTVEYNNPETGYSATYTLDVDVENCQVVQINFPNDGYLDLDHISAADLDEDGNATVDGENGKTYEIRIDN